MVVFQKYGKLVLRTGKGQFCVCFDHEATPRGSTTQEEEFFEFLGDIHVRIGRPVLDLCRSHYKSSRAFTPEHSQYFIYATR